MDRDQIWADDDARIVRRIAVANKRKLTLAFKAKKRNRYERNHKTPIPAYGDNRRYSGAPSEHGINCDYCKGTSATLAELTR